MKNAAKFIYAKYHTLTKDEWDELTNFVYKICDNHDGDRWWKVDNCIRVCVNHALLIREADEEFAELCEEENEDEE